MQRLKELGLRIPFIDSQKRKLVPVGTLSRQEFGKTLDAIVGKDPGDYRTNSYARALFQLPPADVAEVRRVFEIGMNERIFKFRDIFPRDVEYFGLTLSNEHLTNAQKAAKKNRVPLQILIRDIGNGFPQEWKDMDLAMDIYSSSHYSDPFVTINQFHKALKSGGYAVLIPGGIDYAEAARKDPEHTEPHVQWFYKKETSDAVVVLSYGQESIKDALPDIAHWMRSAGFDIPETPTEEEIKGVMRKMSEDLGIDLVTNFDLFFMGFLNHMSKVRFTDIRKFQTPDGAGIVGKKA